MDFEFTPDEIEALMNSRHNKATMQPKLCPTRPPQKRDTMLFVKILWTQVIENMCPAQRVDVINEFGRFFCIDCGKNMKDCGCET